MTRANGETLVVASMFCFKTSRKKHLRYLRVEIVIIFCLLQDGQVGISMYTCKSVCISHFGTMKEVYNV